MQTVVENRFTAWMDNPNDPTINNKIHAADGAKEYGYRAALVGGVTVYGWCVPTILEALGESWLDRGWVEVNFRRPTYPGDEMTISAAHNDDAWVLTAKNQAGEPCITGSAGLGDAPWLGMLELSQRLAPDPEPNPRPQLTLENAPIGKDILTRRFAVSVDDAHAYARNKMRSHDPLWRGEQPFVHPSMFALQMITHLNYCYEYGRPSIHASSHIQHLARARAGQEFTLTGHFIDAYERRGHHYAVFDGDFIAEDGTEVARIRHTNIIKVAKRESS
jgi:hypothetical protein